MSEEASDAGIQVPPVQVPPVSAMIALGALREIRRRMERVQDSTTDAIDEAINDFVVSLEKAGYVRKGKVKK